MTPMILPLLAALAVQTATPLPPPDAETAAVLAPITRLFAALTAKDGAQILAQTRAGGRATAIVAMPDGTHEVRTRNWSEFATSIRDAPSRLEERLINPAVEIDGDIAMVWSPYVFVIDGKVSHCGTDHFDMIRDAGGWKILSITWTQRSTDCPPA